MLPSLKQVDLLRLNIDLIDHDTSKSEVFQKVVSQEIDSNASKQLVSNVIFPFASNFDVSNRL